MFLEVALRLLILFHLRKFEGFVIISPENGFDTQVFNYIMPRCRQDQLHFHGKGLEHT